jgi:hypothetical protein
MNSKEIFPENQRLTILQINELEGFRADKPGYRSSLITTRYSELLVKYHNALVIAENEIYSLKKIIDYKTKDMFQ